MEKPRPPKGLDVPGLVWKARKGRWIGYWVARHDVVKRGFLPKSLSLCSSSDPIEWEAIALQCQSLQHSMLQWSNGLTEKIEPGQVQKIADLVKLYLTDRDSSFHNLRHHTHIRYTSMCRSLVDDVGDRTLHSVTFRDLKRWNDNWREGPDGNGNFVAKAHGLVTMLRIVVAFGAALDVAECMRLHPLLTGRKRGGIGVLNVEMPKKRTDFITADQAVAIRRKAHEMGYPSIALAQALQFELMLRQKDVIGENVPESEPGLGLPMPGRLKWMHGITWSMIDRNLILRKTISKSLRGRKATEGKELTFNLRSYPMVMEELNALDRSSRDELPGQLVALDQISHRRLDGDYRAALGRPGALSEQEGRRSTVLTGPLIINDLTGLPWRTKPFQAKWREIARAAGIPDHVQNRDSRAGGITEATDAAGQDFELVRRHAGHSQPSMTARYSRNHVEAADELAARRVAKRGKP